MPFYNFSNIKNGKEVTLYFHMNDAPKIGSVIEYEGDQLKRLATKPNASIDSIEIDPYSKKDFLKITNKAGGTLGDLWDRSAELSARRAAKDGIDPIAQKYTKEREAQTGISSQADNTKKTKAQERLKKLGVTVKEKKLKR